MLSERVSRCYARLFAAADSEPFIPATHLFFSAWETLEELLQFLDRSGGQ